MRRKLILELTIDDSSSLFQITITQFVLDYMVLPGLFGSNLMSMSLPCNSFKTKSNTNYAINVTVLSFYTPYIRFMKNSKI